MMKENDNSRQRNSNAGTILILLGIIAILIAVLLLLYNIWDSKRAGQEAEKIASELEQEIEQDKDDQDPDQNDFSDDSMPTIEIDGNQYIGILEIPAIQLKLPVMEEWDYERLKISPCRFTGSYYTDDLVICGHNYASHFSPIKWLDIGADVYFTNVKGEVFHYIVSNRETVQPTDITKMTGNQSNHGDESEDWDLSLFTCNTGGQTRCAVRCVYAD